MAKKALINFTTGDKTFEKGHVYADEIVTSEIDASNFEDVSDDALVEATANESVITAEEEHADAQAKDEEINLDEKNAEEFADETTEGEAVADEKKDEEAPAGQAEAMESPKRGFFSKNK